MASVITGITFDKPSYAPGDTITATVTGNWEQADTLTITTGDGASGTGTFEVVEPVKGSDNGSRTWTLVSNTGTQAVLTAVA